MADGGAVRHCMGLLELTTTVLIDFPSYAATLEGDRPTLQTHYVLHECAAAPTKLYLKFPFTVCAGKI